MLAADGHLVVHSTRHAAIEFGKDIITIDRDGVPCAFQLKGNPGRRLTLQQLREIRPQLLELATHPIIHPGVARTTHRCYLVTNGQTDEEVHRSLEETNQELERLGFGSNRITLWSRGHLLEMATRLGASLWPSEIEDLNVLLEILVHRGDDLFPIPKLDTLLQRILFLSGAESTRIRTRELKRHITSAAVLVGVALRNFSLRENHYATVTAWTLFITYSIAACTKHRISYKNVAQAAVHIAKDTVFDSLAALCDEVEQNRKLLMPSGFEIAPIYIGRATLVYALMAAYWIWSSEREWPDEKHKEFLSMWLPRDFNQSYLWGEGAVPQFLVHYWYFSKVDATARSEIQLGNLLQALVQFNLHQPQQNFPGPYFTFEDFIRHLLAGFLASGEDPLRDETARSFSFMAEGLMHLFVRTNLKQAAKSIWPDFTKLGLKHFEPEEAWHYCLYRTNEGNEVMVQSPATKLWDELVTEARECRVRKVPKPLLEEKFILLLFVMVFPYRATPEVLRYLGLKFGTVWFIPPPNEE
jgi:hypothetical protein